MIEAELADGTVLEFPEGTEPSIIQRTVKSMMAEAQAQPESIDLEKFNPADFGNDSPQQQVQQPQPSSLEQAGNLGMEVVSGINRELAGMVDAFGPGAVNEALAILGTDFRIPQAKDFTEPKGTFAGEGFSADIASGVGQGVGMAAGGGALIRQLSKMLPQFSKLESPLLGVVREVSSTSISSSLPPNGIP